MPSSRVVYQNWIAELGRDPSFSVQSNGSNSPGTSEKESADRLEYLRQSVRTALKGLSEDERELIEQIHFMGRCCTEIAGLTGRAEHRLEALHGRALRKLRRKLAPLVKELFGIEPSLGSACPICNSPSRKEIDRLIRERDSSGTWRPVMRRIRADFNLRITTPQTLIGHEKYH
jgi:hypothetical protein